MPSRINKSPFGGGTFDTVIPSDGTVLTGTIQDGAITNPKLAAGNDGEIKMTLGGVIIDATPSQVKTALDITGAYVPKGGWDASTGSFPASSKVGYVYKVTGAGIIDSVDFEVGDELISILNNASTTTYAGNWFKDDNTDKVNSVFTRVGDITAQNGDYTATQITNTPNGNIEAITVQSAINELDSEKEPADSTILKEADIIDNLTSTSTADPLSANQGKVLKDLADTKEPSFTKNTAFNKDFGTTAGTVAEGNDSRITDSFQKSSDTLDDITTGSTNVHLTTTLKSNYDTAHTHSQITTGNPHSVTQGEVGLGNVNNTSDANKPISTATQTALDDKADKVSGAVNGNFAGLDTNGNLTDSGSKSSDFESADATILKESEIIDHLASTSTTNPLSANQGKVLDDKIVILQAQTYLDLIGDYNASTNTPDIAGTTMSSGEARTITVAGTQFTIDFEIGDIIVRNLADNAYFKMDNTEPKFIDGTNPLDAVYTSGNVGIGTTAPFATKPLTVTGEVLFGSATPVTVGDPNSALTLIANNAENRGLIITDANKEFGFTFEYNAASNSFRMFSDWYVSAPSPSLILGTFDNNTNQLVLADSGNVGIGTNSPDALLSVNSATASKVGGGAWAVFSDKRIKKNITTFSKGLKEIEQIKPVEFEYNGEGGIEADGKKYIGVIGQEIEEVLPNTITKVKKEYKGKETELLRYDESSVLYVAINAIKELSAKVTKLEEEIAILRK